MNDDRAALEATIKISARLRRAIRAWGKMHHNEEFFLEDCDRYTRLAISDAGYHLSFYGHTFTGDTVENAVAAFEDKVRETAATAVREAREKLDLRMRQQQEAEQVLGGAQ